MSEEGAHSVSSDMLNNVAKTSFCNWSLPGSVGKQECHLHSLKMEPTGKEGVSKSVTLVPYLSCDGRPQLPTPTLLLLLLQPLLLLLVTYDPRGHMSLLVEDLVVLGIMNMSLQ